MNDRSPDLAKACLPHHCPGLSFMDDFRLPVELFAEILEHLRHAKHKLWLAQCALVCKTWHSIVRPLLFPEIVIYAETEPFDRLMGWEILFSEEPSLMELVKTRHSTILSAGNSSGAHVHFGRHGGFLLCFDGMHFYYIAGTCPKSRSSHLFQDAMAYSTQFVRGPISIHYSSPSPGWESRLCPIFLVQKDRISLHEAYLLFPRFHLEM
jgi:hypothetical protein